MCNWIWLPGGIDARIIAVEIDVVPETRRRDAVVPEFRVHVVARAVTHGRLRQADVEALLAGIETGHRAFHEFRQHGAMSRVLEQRIRSRIKVAGIDANEVEQCTIEAGLYVFRIISRSAQIHVGTPGPDLIYVEVRKILPGQDLRTLVEGTDVNGGAASQKALVKVDGLRGIWRPRCLGMRVQPCERGEDEQPGGSATAGRDRRATLLPQRVCAGRFGSQKVARYLSGVAGSATGASPSITPPKSLMAR